MASFISIQEQVTAINLYGEFNDSRGQVKILSYILGDRTGKQYYNGYSSRNVVIQVDEDKLEVYKEKSTSASPNTVGVIYLFVNPKLKDSGKYTMEVTGTKIDSGKEQSGSASVTITVKQPDSADMTVIEVAGRIGFPLELPCSLIAEQSRMKSFTAVYWRKGPFLSSSKLITQWLQYRESPDFATSADDNKDDQKRISFRQRTSESVFETSLDATLRVSSLIRADFDNWWCEVEFNQEDAVVVYKVDVVPDTVPKYNHTKEGKTDNKPEASLFDHMYVVLDPPYIYYLVGTVVTAIVIIIITCLFIYCVLVPVHDKKRQRRNRRDTQMYPVAHRMSHVSIVPCEICQENAIDCFAMPCGHTYCDECLDNLIKSSSVCVFCRRAIHKKQRLYNKIQTDSYL
ncbi:uncharacterized protein LOC134854092 isoform X2 [Symsagittifera roscoffensis]